MMINTLKLFVIVLVVVGIQSCGNEERKTASGLTYTLVEEGEGAVVEDGQYMLMNMSYTDNNDSVWMSTAEKGIPVVVPKDDSVWRNSTGSIEQIFNELKKGDSITFTMSINDFFENSVKSPVPPNVDKDGSLTFAIGVENVLNQEEIMAWQQEMMQKQQKKMESESGVQLEKDVKLIEDYLAENNIDAEKTESGLFYVIKKEGNGQQAEAGDTVKVNYAGHVLNGPYFDTSIESVAKENDIYNEQRPGGYVPLDFALGQGRVIQGWDEGIALLKEGGEATLYIPSGLAYGPRQRSEEIKANSILIFDVELVEVVKGENE